MKILFIAPLPPPVHGSAMVSQYIKESRVVNEAFDCDFVNLSTSRSMEEIGKGGIKKLFRFLASYLIVLWKLITHRYSLCYLAITCHGMGFLKDAPFVLLCKLFCRKVVLHQHNKGLSRDVARWPYRWLMPLVYRNTTVMLLSWHLYEDISAVVKREQVVACANGVPPLDNGQQSTDNGLLRDETSNLTQKSQNTQKNISEQGCQRELDTNSQNARIASLACGHPDEGFGLTQKSQKSQNLHDASPVPSGVGSQSHAGEIVNGQQTTDNSQLSTDGLFNQHDKHTNLDASTHTQACAGHPDGSLSHTEFTEDTEFSCNAENICQRELDTNSQNARIASLACGHPDEGFDLTQKSQKSQKNIVSQDKQSTLDENSQNLQVASPLLASGVGSHREAQFSSSLSSSLEPSAPRLLFLSNLIESKGIYVLLEACRMLKEEGIVFQCDYVGGESKLISGESFRNAIAERGLTDCVTYHGPQYGAAKDRFFRGADIFVQPTSDDCFPLTLVEAMQYRLPIVSTDVGAIPDIVTDGVNGFVCPQRDVDALAVALRKLIAEPQMRVAMGQRGYELYRERMTLEVFEMRFTGLLKGIVGNG